MKTQQPLTLLFGAMAICFGTLALTRSTEAQGIKSAGSSTQQILKNQQLQANVGAGELRGDVSHFVVDDNFAWAVVGTTVYRIDRNNMSMSAAALKASSPAEESKPDLVGVKSSLRGILKPPGR